MSRVFVLSNAEARSVFERGSHIFLSLLRPNHLRCAAVLDEVTVTHHIGLCKIWLLYHTLVGTFKGPRNWER